MTTIALPWARPPVSLNDRGHWRVKARNVADARAQARWAIRAAHPPQLERAHITLCWRVPDMRRRDLDNLAGTLKPCLDALVDEGVLPDDDFLHVKGATSRIYLPDASKVGAMWLNIEDAG